MIRLDESSKVPLYEQIYRQFYQSIANGMYPTGSKLPSIRALAESLHCARNTVEAAYRLLTQEGLITAKAGVGYIVEDTTHLHALTDSAKAARDRTHQNEQARATLSANESVPPILYDFTYGPLQAGTFPNTTWRSLTDEILLGADASQANCYTDPLGNRDLRCEIAWRIATERGVRCTPDQIIVQAGTQDGIQNLLTLFNAVHDTIAFEEPGYSGVRHVMERNGFSLIPCRIGNGEGTFIEDVEKSGARLVYVTPSSQFPTGYIMTLDTRKRLLAWACATDAYIMEDDYCREFRYLERDQPPLQAMDDAERVVYMGTFSKSLSPALRISYLILPEPLLARWKMLFADAYTSVPWLSQAVLARFLAGGHWDRHLRRVQTSCKGKHETLSRTLRDAMGDRVGILDSGTGLHLLVNVLDGRSQEELIATARNAGVAVYSTQGYWISTSHPLQSCVLVGFSAIPEEDIIPGIATLAQAWFG